MFNRRSGHRVRGLLCFVDSVHKCGFDSQPALTSMHALYSEVEPSRTEVDALPGIAVIEFGANWCGVCRATRPAITAALARHPAVRHLRIADGSGRPLGRSFGVKLWPTLILLHDGKENERLVRPRGEAAIGAALDRLAAV